jgi:hypothetical protein
MGFNDERNEIRNIYKGINNLAKQHNIRPGTLSTFDTITLHPFKNKIKGAVISTNRYDGPEFFGFDIVLEKIESGIKHICISFTPLKVTTNFWDNDRRDLVRNLASKFNHSLDLFQHIKGIHPREDYIMSKVNARIDKDFGLQLYCYYQYSTLNFSELFYNFSNISSYADNCSVAIHDSYKITA